MYCAQQFRTSDLTRDHITPISRGGGDVWTNVVTACRRCNNYKGGRTPEQAGMQLVAVPFTPTYAEYIYLKGRRRAGRPDGVSADALPAQLSAARATQRPARARADGNLTFP